MKTGAFNRKFIYNHLLAIALAGIVSLLFLQRVCQFLDTSSKRLDYETTSTYGGQESLEHAHITPNGPGKTGIEGLIDIQGILDGRLHLQRFVKLFPISTHSLHVNFQKRSFSKSCFRYCLPSIWGPSIPIAHRRLII